MKKNIINLVVSIYHFSGTGWVVKLSGVCLASKNCVVMQLDFIILKHQIKSILNFIVRFVLKMYSNLRKGKTFRHLTVNLQLVSVC